MKTSGTILRVKQPKKLLVYCASFAVSSFFVLCVIYGGADSTRHVETSFNQEEEKEGLFEFSLELKLCAKSSFIAVIIKFFLQLPLFSFRA